MLRGTQLPTPLSRQGLLQEISGVPTAGLQGRRRETEHLHEQVVPLLGVLLHQVLQHVITLSDGQKRWTGGGRRLQGKRRGAQIEMDTSAP